MSEALPAGTGLDVEYESQALATSIGPMCNGAYRMPH